MKNIFTLALLTFSFYIPVSAQFTNSDIDKILTSNIDTLQGGHQYGGGHWQFVYKGTMMFIMTDSTHNRMRIFSPIVEVDSLENGQMEAMLDANFDKSLDVRYCSYDGTIISAFIHPLEELKEWQFIDGILQVKGAVENFGDSFSSGGLELNTPQKARKAKVRQL